MTISIKKSLVENLSKKQRADKELVRNTIKDILKCYLLYSTTPNDYFLFGFGSLNKTHSKRKTFVTDTFKDHALVRYDGADKYRQLSNKYAVYKRIPQYFKRKIMLLDKNVSFEDFNRFILKRPDVFIKPMSGSYGRGAMIFSGSDRLMIRELYEKLTVNENESWIIEERIKQDEMMAQWNVSSVNTIRFTSILSRKGYHVFTPVLRTGRMGCIVDNGGSGGILANIDMQTGCIYSDGVDEHGHIYKTHPDTFVRYKGWQIPQWKELLSIAECVHSEMPENKYVGWDFALSESGWVLIEGNWGQFLNQYVDKKGRKPEFYKYIKE